MKCVKCEVVKDSVDFYANDKKCKDCRKAMVKANRLAKLDYYKEYDKKRASDPERVAARKAYAESEAGKAAGARAKLAWQDRNKKKRKAHISVGNAVRDGRLIKQSCEVCGDQVVDAHHDDYDKPLDVRWLCHAHHNEWHAKNGEGLNP